MKRKEEIKRTLPVSEVSLLDAILKELIAIKLTLRDWDHERRTGKMWNK